MTTNDNIIEGFANSAVEINGLVVPARELQKTLSRHTFNLFTLNDDDIYKISLIGSATAVRFKDREILLTTKHQLVGIDESRIAMLTDSGSHLVTANGMRSFRIDGNSDAYDIAAFDFSQPCRDIPELKKRFFEFKEIPPNITNVQILAILLTGYPSSEQQYEIHENNHLGLVRQNITCLPDSQPSDLALLRVKPVEQLKTHPDGFSGGSAFVIQMSSGGPKAYFAGIVLRGGKQAFYILKAGYVWSFLESAFG